MGRSKLDKFRDNELNDHIIQPGKQIFQEIKGNWNRLQFRNDHPIVVELGCGRGEYTVGLARLFKQKNHIGVDIKGPRIWNGARIALKEKLDNVAFLRVQIQNLEEYIANEEVSEIWITFPDPRPKKSDEHRRLTHPRFLGIYRNVMQKGGMLHLKTDDTGLFEYSLEILAEQPFIRDLQFTHDLYSSDMLSMHHDIKTNYEMKFLEEGTTIKYLNCKLH